MPCLLSGASRTRLLALPSIVDDYGGAFTPKTNTSDIQLDGSSGWLA